MTEIKAKLRYVRLSPKKIRPVVNSIRNLTALQAEHKLSLQNFKSAPIILKLLKSAISSAKHDYKISKDNLKIKSISVDKGPVLKRFKPRAFGRAGAIRKPSSHIYIVLTEIKEILKKNTKNDKKDKVVKDIDKNKKIIDKKSEVNIVDKKTKSKIKRDKK